MRSAVAFLGIVLLVSMQGLPPDASISGRVTDLNPVSKPANVNVQLGVNYIMIGGVGYRDGRRAFVSTLSTALGPDGHYQLRNVKPGEYYVQVISPTGVPVYYPGTRNIDAATKILVKAGQDILGIDIETNGGPTFKVTGKVLNVPNIATGANSPPIPTPIIGFVFASTDRRTLDPFGGPLALNMAPRISGEFEINLPEGEWDIFPLIPATSRLMPNASAYPTARARVLLRDRDLDNVVVSVGSVDVKGRVVVPGSSQEAAAGVRVALLPKDNYPRTLVEHLRSPMVVGLAGDFTFATVPPGRYFFQISPIPPGLYVADIRVGTKSIFEDGILTVGGGSIDPVEVVLSRDGGTIRTIPTGIIAALAVNGSQSRIVLIPADRRENGLLYKSFSSVQGVTGIRDVAPGRYKVFAFQEIPSGGAEQDPEFMAPYEDMGVTIDVAAGQTVEVRVPWIPAEVMRRQ